MVRVVIGIVVLVILIGIALWFFDTDITQNSKSPENGPIIMTGTIVCLPKDGTGPQTLECAFGLYGDDKNYYQLRDTNATSGPSRITTFAIGTEVEITGIFMTEDDPSYATVGTITLEHIAPVDETSAPEETNSDALVHSDGVITFSVPDNFGFAISDVQILVDSSIPPCTSPFLYCLYYNGHTYDATTFESAGLAIRTRDDLHSESACLTTPPAGYDSLSPAATQSSQYHAMSIFTPLQDAATGQYAYGEEFRLYTSDICYAFTTRVGVTAIQNLGTTTKTAFTDKNRDTVLSELRTMVGSVSLEQYNSDIGIPAE